MKSVFGIDLGTTYSCIAYIDEYGKPVVLKNSDGQHTTPSVVMLEAEGNVIVGEEAKRSVPVDPDHTVQFIKRKIGRENDKVNLNGKSYTASEISSYILKKVVQDANDELLQTGVIQPGEEIRDAVITCPAYFGVNEREATRLAGQMAGLNVINIINEPTAAAISYGASGQNKQETILVYDLGGGTFDITIITIHDNQIQVIATGGDDQLGGKDWDEAIMGYVVNRYLEEYGEDLSEDPDAVAALSIQVENWKRSLSVREKVTISATGADGDRLRDTLTREKFESLTANLLMRTQNLIDDTINKARQKMPSLHIDRILLVGGSSRMPQVKEMLQSHYGIEASLADPDEAVAKGAAIYANNEKKYQDFVTSEAKKRGVNPEHLQEDQRAIQGIEEQYSRQCAISGERRLTISNVLSRSYGVKVWDGGNKFHIANLLLINDQLPASCEDQFATASDNQGVVEIELYESRSNEREMPVPQQDPVAVITMKLNRAVPCGTPLTIRLTLDNAGTMHVIAHELMYDSRLDTVLQLSAQMSEAELNTAIARSANATVE